MDPVSGTSRTAYRPPKNRSVQSSLASLSHPAASQASCSKHNPSAGLLPDRVVSKSAQSESEPPPFPRAVPPENSSIPQEMRAWTRPPGARSRNRRESMRRERRERQWKQARSHLAIRPRADADDCGARSTCASSVVRQQCDNRRWHADSRPDGDTPDGSQTGTAGADAHGWDPPGNRCGKPRSAVDTDARSEAFVTRNVMHNSTIPPPPRRPRRGTSGL